MNASDLTWRRGWVIGAGLLSLVVPVTAIMLQQEPAAPFGDPARLSYYRQTVGALVLGIAFAVGAFVGTRARMPGWSRGLSLVLATLGLLISAYLLMTLIGSCGVGVLAGSCNP